MASKQHWERVYSTRQADAVSWYQEHAELSLRLIEATGLPRSAAIIDVGGGASTLVDDLLARGYRNLTVLDLSTAALAAARTRLGAAADGVAWLAADVTQAALPPQAYDIWHDRAAFHFLSTEASRQAYVRQATAALKPDGHAIIATFAEDGPLQCSGLPVRRYSAAGLAAELGAAFTLVSEARERHTTPGGASQTFLYCRFRKSGRAEIVPDT